MVAADSDDMDAMGLRGNANAFLGSKLEFELDLDLNLELELKIMADQDGQEVDGCSEPVCLASCLVYPA